VITDPGQVEIFEPILKDPEGHVTTGLLKANGYLKDNRILPRGFDKQNAAPEIAVYGEARNDTAFLAGQSTVSYRVQLSEDGPYSLSAELWYQPIGYRWAHNLDTYRTHEEPRRFTDYYASMANTSAIMIAKAEVTAGGGVPAGAPRARLESTPKR
jgi:hypothetical protein